MKNRYRSVKVGSRGGTFYCEDTNTGNPLRALQAMTTAMSASNAPTAANKMNGWTPKLMARDVG